MKPNELVEQIGIEFDSIQLTVDELNSLYRDIAVREPTVRELAAAGTFLANFYNGIENILKRICRFHDVEIPAGGDWHVELVKSFCDPPRNGLPLLLHAELAEELAPYRQFRHVVHHSYGFRLRWPDMLPGVEGADRLFSEFRSGVVTYVTKLQS